MKKVLKPIASAAIAVLAVTSFSCSKEESNKKDDNNKNNETSLEFKHDGHSYLIVKELKTWAEAAKDAAERGGYLVEIGSLAEQEAVYKGIRNAGISTTYTKVNDGGGIAYVWIGAMATAERAWIWNGANKTGQHPVFWIGNKDGSAIAGSYVNWGGKSAGKFNEPDDYTHPTYAPNGQNVAAIGLQSWPAGSSIQLGIAGEWNDIANSNKLYYVVEFDK